MTQAIADRIAALGAAISEIRHVAPSAWDAPAAMFAAPEGAADSYATLVVRREDAGGAADSYATGYVARLSLVAPLYGEDAAAYAVAATAAQEAAEALMARMRADSEQWAAVERSGAIDVAPERVYAATLAAVATLDVVIAAHA